MKNVLLAACASLLIVPAAFAATPADVTAPIR
jgi:hypothetical protein